MTGAFAAEKRPSASCFDFRNDVGGEEGTRDIAARKGECRRTGQSVRPR